MSNLELKKTKILHSKEELATEFQNTADRLYFQHFLELMVQIINIKEGELL